MPNLAGICSPEFPTEVLSRPLQVGAPARCGDLLIKRIRLCGHP